MKLTRKQAIEMVLDLYDEMDEMKAQVERAKTLTLEDEEGKVDLSPMASYILELGATCLQEKLVGTWSFGYNAPKVRDDDGAVISYEDWRAQITMHTFESRELTTVLASPGVSYDEVIKVIEPALFKYYQKKVDEQ